MLSVLILICANDRHKLNIVSFLERIFWILLIDVHQSIHPFTESLNLPALEFWQILKLVSRHLNRR